jgi:hypothetical protein
VNSLLPVALFALAGILVGGLVSMRRQGAGRNAIVAMAALACLAAAGGVLWLMPGN